jgi:KDO2-lipid IV(A) lauroyltransferase
MFIFFRAATWLFSRFPFPLLFVFSDLLRIIIEYLVRYRKTTITANLHNAFPEKSKGEISKIRRSYYRNICDVFLETIKLESMSPEEVKARFTFTGMEIINDSVKRQKSVIVTNGHIGNWEWLATSLGLAATARLYAAAKPIKHRGYHQYVHFLRHRHDAKTIIPFGDTYRTLIRNKKNGPTLTLLIGDQTPTPEHLEHWQNFLNQDTPFLNGAERLAKALDFDVVYVDVVRTGRGKYTGEIKLISNDAPATADHEITSAYVKLLEQTIMKAPDNWLWSHRRWKHKKSAS